MLVKHSATRQNTSTTFGVYLETAIRNAGISTAEFCRRAGIERRAFDYWRTGHNYPSLLMVFKICNTLGIRASEVVTEAMADAVERGLA